MRFGTKNCQTKIKTAILPKNKIKQQKKMEKIKKVNKEDYHVHKFISGYYGICEQSSGVGCVYGGDSACEDHYNEDYINDVYEKWDGTLHYTEKYGKIAKQLIKWTN